MDPLITFAQALADAPAGKKRLILGNGFSRALRNDIFAYDALFDRADFANTSDQCRGVFEALETTDFEMVIRGLRNTARICRVYASDRPELSRELDNDASALREILAAAIASSHPSRPTDISQAQYASCREFLRNFEAYYTLNYDLLLYWTMMQDRLGPPLRHDDGFRRSDLDRAEYVVWEVENSDRQNVHYLHGALHIFDAGAEVQKYTWTGTGIALIEQIRAALAVDKYPIFVAEGTAVEKMARIQRSGILNRAYRSLAKIGDSLFVYGLAMKDNDNHIVNIIKNGKIKYLAVGVYGDPRSRDNAEMIESVGAIADERPPDRPLRIRFYDAQSARVWG